MASVTPPDVVAAHFSAKSLENIRLMIAKRLKDEDLRMMKQLRDISPQVMSDDPDFIRVYRQKQSLVWEQTWHDYLQTLRRDLPTIVTGILNDLEKEFCGYEEPTLPLPEHEQRRSEPLTPQSASKECAMDIDEPSVPAPVPDPVPSTTGASGAPMAPIEGANRGDSSESVRSFRSFTMPMTSPADVSNKRRLDHAEGSKTTNKRTKNAEQGSNRVLTLSQLKEGECVFKYEGHEGFYVLRCERERCKKEFKQDMIWFDIYPFTPCRAEEHFSIPGHGVKDNAKIFQKFSWRVTDATEELNIDGPAHDLPAPPEPHRPASPPKSPATARDKGKEPAPPINQPARTSTSKDPGSNRRNSCSGSSSSSVETVVNEPSALPTRPVPTTPARKVPDKTQRHLDEMFSVRKPSGSATATPKKSAYKPAVASSSKSSASGGGRKGKGVTIQTTLPAGPLFVASDLRNDDDDESYREEGEIVEDDEGIPPLEEVITPRSRRQRKDVSYEDVPLGSNEFLY
ncbi:hypothetical protein F4810DRAFT_576809 [Camillea tinctor]|nr:hypothetical protein F4810DRAFT_576809 [Camillea tinctor]